MLKKGWTGEDILAFMRQASYKPLSYQELIQELELGPEEEGRLAKVLGRLEKEGEIVKTRRGKYGLPEMMNLVRGTLSMTARGFAFVIPDDAAMEDIFVMGGDLNGAMHNDRVMVRLSRLPEGERRAEGEVVRILKRANTELVGTFRKKKQLIKVTADDPRLNVYPIYVKKSKKLVVKDGDKVVVKINSWPGKDEFVSGTITEVLGAADAPGVDVVSIIRKYQLRDRFPEEVLKEAEEAARPVSAEDIEGRVDLTGLRMVTIDGEDARDLDDAVSISRWENGGYELGVHIADVSHYVKEGTLLDKEARERATSVYLVDRVLPMLPPVLSNGICSLNAGEPRLAISCLMKIDQRGEVKDYRIVKSVIRVDERMTYTAVNRILIERDPELTERYRHLVEDFELMRELSAILRQRREKRGALDFDFPEAKVILDDEGHPLAIKKRERNVAENLIEDFMIAANEVVAEHCFAHQIPALYRVHERPDEEKIADLNRLLAIYGLSLRDNPEPKAVQAVLKVIKDRPEERVINTMVLRAMRHARYTPQALGHFGLASRYYCHFTSPIRRYPDLVVHRVLTLLFNGDLSERRKTSLASRLPTLGEHCSVREMAAEEAERESVDIKKAQYMAPLVGRVFAGTISSVLSFGFFVELANTVEGLVHISTVSDDYYIFDDRTFTLYGKHRGRQFRIGDNVVVKLVNVNVAEAKIDFELYEGTEEPLDLEGIEVEERIITPQISFADQFVSETGSGIAETQGDKSKASDEKKNKRKTSLARNELKKERKTRGRKG